MKRYGLIGYPLSHSFSQKYFSEKFRKEGITDCIYENFPIPSITELDQVIHENQDLKGLNVTIPYKQQVISFLDDSSELPLNACNCIKIEAGKKIGYNTDAIGFGISLQSHLESWHTHALVLGKGGASEAVQYVLGRLGISCTLVGRRVGLGDGLTYQDLTAEIIRENLLIINTTPLGMYPKIDECPAIPYPFLTSRHYLFDLVYNPAKTLFLQKGEEHGTIIKNGSDMLVIQAEESWRIWNS
ncbi:MAG TPA: shikimate dehydrogenase [Puia sp.]|nr:shikimate dehydrogenase [Puia sp.]